MRYREEIDGLRTVAVLPVVIFHLGYGVIGGGYYGVDVFFVISGYLITRILTDSIREERFSMLNFWIRRVKRLLPALLTVVLVMLLIAPVLVFRPVVKDITADVLPAIFSYFNIHALTQFGNYWGSKSNNSFFLHVWSLSVEEQFYILYPFFLFFSYKYLRKFFAPLLFITICSFLLFIFLIGKNRDFAFYMLPTRMWELSLGGLASLITFDTLKRPQLASSMALLGILLICVSYFAGKESISGLVVLPTFGTTLVLLFASKNNIVGKILSKNIFVTTGKLSYSIYLWHWPLIVLFKNMDYQLHHINRHLINLVILILTLAFAYLSFKLIEQKTRNYRQTPKLVALSILVISGLTFSLFKFFPMVYPANYNKLTDYFRYYDISPKQVAPSKNSLLNFNVEVPDRPEKYSDAYKSEGIITRIDGKDPEIILFGDSHGVMWARLLDEISEELKISRSFYTSNASKPFFNVRAVDTQTSNYSYSAEQRKEYARSIIKNLEQWNPKVFLIACRWENLNGSDKVSLNDLLSFLKERNVSVVFLNQPPRLTFMDNRNSAQYFSYLGIKPSDSYSYVDLYKNESVVQSNEYLESIKKEHPGVYVYNVFGKMTNSKQVKVLFKKDVLYYDDDHLSYPGTLVSKDELKNIIIEKISA